MTRYTYQTTITIRVDMADEGENFEGEPVHWDSPAAQEESAREYADQAINLLGQLFLITTAAIFWAERIAGRRL